MKTNTTKSKYVKPSITAVEWDFNESVCQAITSSYTIQIGSPTGSNSRTISDMKFEEGDLTWHEWPSGSPIRR